MSLKVEKKIIYSYINGSVRIKDLLINIQPRIANLSTNHYLEIQLYNEGILNDKISSLLGENESFGIQENLIELFLKEAYELVNHGVEGEIGRATCKYREILDWSCVPGKYKHRD